MKRRVYHLAKKASLSPEAALARLRKAGYSLNSINDQLSPLDVRGALDVLKNPQSILHDPHAASARPAAVSPSRFPQSQTPELRPSTFDLHLRLKPTPIKPPPGKKPNRIRTIHYLDTQSLLALHSALVEMFAQENDPIFPSGPKDVGLLDSAAHRPQTSLGDSEKYTTFHSKAASLFHSMVKNHPFHNGNKRTALVALVVFLDVNGWNLKTSDDALFDFVIRTASSTPTGTIAADAEVQEIAAWLDEHAERVKDKTRGMSTADFCAAVEKAGGRYRDSRRGGGIAVWGPNGDSITISRATTDLDGNVIRRYLRNLGLSQGQSGIHFDEFEKGVDKGQRLIRRFRIVLKKLANA